MSGEEWSTHRKLHELKQGSVRGTIPPGFSYFCVSFGIAGTRSPREPTTVAACRLAVTTSPREPTTLAACRLFVSTVRSRAEHLT